MTTVRASRHEALVSHDGVVPSVCDPWLSLRARWCSSGQTPWRQQGTPAGLLPPMRDRAARAVEGGVVAVPQALRCVASCTVNDCATRDAM
jgi:hypothetical protein